MRCPNCEGTSLCPCKSCVGRKPNRLEPKEVWLDNEVGLVACGHCGFAMIMDAWTEMDMDLYLPAHDYTQDGYPEIPGSTLTWEEAREKYRPMGKMPGEKGYGVSFRAHWQVRLWRWRGIIGHTFPLLVGRGNLYGKTRIRTIANQFAKF